MKISEPACSVDVCIPACASGFWGSPWNSRASACRCAQLFETLEPAKPRVWSPLPRVRLSTSQHFCTPNVVILPCVGTVGS